MDADPRDARIAELEAQLREAWGAIKADEVFKNELERLRLAERTRRKRGGERLPAGAWECIGDSEIIQSAMDVLRRLWHKDDDNYRKATMHLSRLQWAIREKLRDYL